MNIQNLQSFFVASSAKAAVLAIQNQQQNVMLCSSAAMPSSANEEPIATLTSPPLSMIADTLLQLKAALSSRACEDEKKKSIKSTGGSKVIILVQYPTNPNGYFYSPNELEAMVMEICAIKQVCLPLATQAEVELVLMTGALSKENEKVGLSCDYLERVHEATSGEVVLSLNPWVLQELVSAYNSDKVDSTFTWNDVPTQFHGGIYYPLPDNEKSKSTLENICDSSTCSIIPVFIRHVFSVAKEKDDIKPIISTCLVKSNGIFLDKSFRLRHMEGNDEDVSSLLGLVRELAEYEKALDSCHASKEMYIRDGFGQKPYFNCFLLENVDDNGLVVTCGYALWYIGYSTSEGRFLYLEDLYIQERFRGRGIGKNIMYTLADVASSFDCGRFGWQALDWNTPARKFYERIGAVELPDWITIRMDRSKIASFLSTR